MVSIDRSAQEAARPQPGHQHRAPTDPSHGRQGKQGGMTWAQCGVVALATTSGLLGKASAQLTPFADIPGRGVPHRLGGVKKVTTPLQPGHATLAFVANRSNTVTATPGLPGPANTWYGLSAHHNATSQVKTKSFGRRLLGLTPFGGGGNSPRNAPPISGPPVGAPSPSGSPFTPSCNTPNPPQPAPAHNGTLITAQLQGCPYADYSAPVNVGGQALLAIADTGSTTFGVVSSKCTDCDVTSTYKPGTSSRDDGIKFEADYGMGEWLGELTNDVVSFAGGPSVNMAFGAVYDQKDWIAGNVCDLTASEPGPPINQATMGLGGPANLLNGTDSWVEKANSSFAYPAITFGLCDQNGAIYLGGYPENNAASTLIYTPMVSAEETPYIAVAMEGMSVADTDIGAKLSDFGYTIIDTGSTAITFPPDVYAAIASGISSGTSGAITQDFFDQGQCIAQANTAVSDLNEQAPSLTFNFYNAANASSFNTLTVPAANSYLLAQSDGNGGLVVCPLMVNSGSDNPQTLLGNTIMRGFLTIFDYEKQQVGFALSKGICKSS